MTFANCYEDAMRARAYAELEFANTYYLAYRDLPDIIRLHATGTKALDFGCGTGRSTRFARRLGLDVAGADIAPKMIAKAREIDPSIDYSLIQSDELRELPRDTYDLILSLFTFDNIATPAKLRLFRTLGALLKPSGKIISVVSSPEMYVHEWASFSTNGYPENSSARSGDRVRNLITDASDHRPVEDILCTDESYREIYAQTGLNLVATYRPLAKGDEPYPWVNETTLAPWTIYVLSRT